MTSLVDWAHRAELGSAGEGCHAIRTRGRRHFLQRSAALAGVGLLAGCGALPSWMQQPATIRRIGFLEPSAMPPGSILEPFRDGLHDLGWVEGENLTIEIRVRKGGPNGCPRWPTSWSAPVDLIYAPPTSVAIAAQQVTSTIPIVFATVRRSRRARAGGQSRPSGRQSDRAVA